MISKRTLTVAAALGLLAALAVPTAASAHEMIETEVHFDGNYLWVGTFTTGPVDSIQLDVYDGAMRLSKGKPQHWSVVNSVASLYTWVATGNGACTAEWDLWRGESVVYAAATNVVFDTPYDGSLTAGTVLHGLRNTYHGVVIDDGAGEWCETPTEPAFVTDIGIVPFTADATWTSEVELKGKKLVKVRTTVEFTNVTFDSVDLTPITDEESPWAAAMPRRFPFVMVAFGEEA